MKKQGGNIIQTNIIKGEKVDYLQKEYPKKLLNINQYPQRLYYEGNVKLLNSEKIVAIVGSRDCTEYGRKYAQIFATELAKQNICVVSGLALGIDTAAHCGAMSEIGGTIAVLGGGLSNIYPKENKWLFHQILYEKGCVITEYNYYEEMRKSNFPKRNRIISGIADAVLVVEASHRSGSKITAEYAKGQRKKIYCIPNSLDSKNIAGIKELIKDGAKVVTSPTNLISDLYTKETTKANRQEYSKEESKQINILEIPEQFRQIYIILQDKMCREEIARQSQCTIEQINTTLTMMEIEGYIKQIEGNYFTRS